MFEGYRILLLEIVFFFYIELLRLHCDIMNHLYIQFDVTLRDLGQPVSRSTNDVATVTVNVNRNEFAPIFFNSTYYADILETQAVGSGVVTVTAQDQDTSVWTYSHCFNSLEFNTCLYKD